MSTNIVNQMPYLRTTRSFKEDLGQLSTELNKAYVDTANVVNARTIGLFATNKASINGEEWFIDSGKKRQGFRQAYVFTAAGNIPHGLNFSDIFMFTRCYGEYTDGTNWYGVISASSVAIAGQISFYLDPTNIVILDGGGSPAIVNGIVVIEWLSNV